MMVLLPLTLRDSHRPSYGMCRTKSESCGAAVRPRERMGSWGRSKSMAARCCASDAPVPSLGGRNRRISTIVPREHRVSSVSADKWQEYCMMEERPASHAEEAPEMMVSTSVASSRENTPSPKWARGHRSTPSSPRLVSAAFVHSAVDLPSAAEGAHLQRSESKVRMLLRGVGSFFKAGKRKLQISSVSYPSKL